MTRTKRRRLDNGNKEGQHDFILQIAEKAMMHQRRKQHTLLLITSLMYSILMFYVYTSLDKIDKKDEMSQRALSRDHK